MTFFRATLMNMNVIHPDPSISAGKRNSAVVFGRQFSFRSKLVRTQKWLVLGPIPGQYLSMGFF
jgi:hypothetical protein